MEISSPFWRFRFGALLSPALLSPACPCSICSLSVYGKDLHRSCEGEHCESEHTSLSCACRTVDTTLGENAQDACEETNAKGDGGRQSLLITTDNIT